MTEYNTLSAKLSNSQLNKSKLRIKSGTEVVLNFLSHDDSNDETHFPYKLLLNYQKLKNQKSQVAQLGGFLPALFQYVLVKIISGKVTPETIDLIKNNKDLLESENNTPKFYVNAGPNILEKKLIKKLSPITGSEIALYERC